MKREERGEERKEGIKGIYLHLLIFKQIKMMLSVFLFLYFRFIRETAQTALLPSSFRRFSQGFLARHKVPLYFSKTRSLFSTFPHVCLPNIYAGFLFNFGDHQNYIRSMKKEIERKRVKETKFTSKCCNKKKKQILRNRISLFNFFPDQKKKFEGRLF